MQKLNKWLLGINLLFLQAYLIRFQIGPYPSHLQEALIITNLAVFILLAIQEKRLALVIRNLKKHWILISFVVLTTVSTLLNPLPQFIDFVRHLKFLFFGLILAFIFLETFKTEKDRLTGLKILGLGAITFGLFSLFYNLLGYNLTHDSRLLGPLDSAVYLAYYLTPFFLLFTILFLEKGKRNYLIYAIILGLLIIGTRSMGAIGGSFIILLIYLLKRFSKTIFKSKIITGGLILVTIAIAGAIFYAKILPTFTTTYSSLDERGEIWRTSIKLLEEPGTFLGGLGPSQFEFHYIETVREAINNRPLDYFVIQPHNIFLLFIFHYGILGLIFLIFCIYQTLATILYHKGKSTVPFMSALMLSYFFIHGLIDSPFYKNDLLFLLILFLQLALGPSPLKQHKDRLLS